MLNGTTTAATAATTHSNPDKQQTKDEKEDEQDKIKETSRRNSCSQDDNSLSEIGNVEQEGNDEEAELEDTGRRFINHSNL